MIRYPHYIKNLPNACGHFRLAVIHRLLMQHTDCPTRLRYHSFHCGWWCGRMGTFKSCQFRDESIDVAVYNEAVRLFQVLEAEKKREADEKL